MASVPAVPAPINAVPVPRAIVPPVVHVNAAVLGVEAEAVAANVVQVPAVPAVSQIPKLVAVLTVTVGVVRIVTGRM